MKMSSMPTGASRGRPSEHCDVFFLGGQKDSIGVVICKFVWQLKLKSEIKALLGLGKAPRKVEFCCALHLGQASKLLKRIL